jgi:hypothetical protein
MTTKPKSDLIETYKGYQIRHRPWLKRHDWRCQVPNAEGSNRWCNVASHQRARQLIDRQLLLMRLKQR